jgi:hypothetical protein
MTNPEVLKQLFKEAREEMERWPDWMKQEEQERDRLRLQRESSDADEDERLSA